MNNSKKEIRTIAWVHYIANVIDHEKYADATRDNGNIGKQTLINHQEPLIPARDGTLALGTPNTFRTHALQKKTGQPAQYWSRYRSGKSPVSTTIRKLVEQKVPGSSQIYSIGPLVDSVAVPLWAALWSNNEEELWTIAKSISESIRFHQAYDSEESTIFDYVLLKQTSTYFKALTTYFEGLARVENRGMLDIHDFTALIAAFRLGQFRQEAASHQASLGHFLEAPLSDTSAHSSLLSYGIFDYINQYLTDLVPHSERHYADIPIIDRQTAASSYLKSLTILIDT